MQRPYLLRLQAGTSGRNSTDPGAGRKKATLPLVAALLALTVACVLSVFAAAGLKTAYADSSKSAGQVTVTAEAAASASANSSPALSAGTDSGTIQVTDSVGRHVQIPAEPQRIAIFDSFSSELAVLIGAGPKLSGVPNGIKSDVILQQIYPGLTQLTATSGNSINIETQLSDDVDLVLLRSTMDSSECAKLDLLGIPYVKVGYNSIESQVKAIRLVGTACGTAAAGRAEAIARYYEQTVSLVQERVASIAQDQRVSVYHAVTDALTTDGADSLGASWITATGCRNVSATETASSNTDYLATLEQVYSWNPDIIICSSASTASTILETAGWQGLEAVTSASVYNIPVGATRWGHRGSVETWFAMLWLGTTAYPELFADIDLEQTVIDAYADLYGVQVDDALYQQMLSGEGLRTQGGGGSGSSGSGSGGSGSGPGTGGGSGSGSGSSTS